MSALITCPNGIGILCVRRTVISSRGQERSPFLFQTLPMSLAETFRAAESEDLCPVSGSGAPSVPPEPPPDADLNVPGGGGDAAGPVTPHHLESASGVLARRGGQEGGHGRPENGDLANSGRVREKRVCELPCVWLGQD